MSKHHVKNEKYTNRNYNLELLTDLAGFRGVNHEHRKCQMNCPHIEIHSSKTFGIRIIQQCEL